MALHQSLLTSTAPAAIGPDATAIKALNEFAAMSARRHAADFTPAEDAATTPAYDALHKRCLSLRTTTAEGHAARARALAVYLDPNEAEEWHWSMAEALLRDMLDLPDDDAELIALCAAFEENERAIRAIYDDPGRRTTDEAAAEQARPFEDKTTAMLDRLAQLRASTATGIHARARVLAAHNGDAVFGVDDPDTVAGRLYECLCRDARALQMERVPT